MSWPDVDERIIETAELDEHFNTWNDEEFIWLTADEDYYPYEEVPTLY